MSEVGDIIKGLNLPKQILDKATALAKTLFGPAANEVGEMFADQVRFRRMKNQVVIFNKTVDLLEKNNLKPRKLNVKTLVPLLEQSSLEEDELLQEKWATLIANIASTPESGLEPKLVKTLSSLSSLEARILDFVSEEFERERENLFKRSKSTGWPKCEFLEDIGLRMVVIFLHKVEVAFDLDTEIAKICIDNLVALGLLRYEEAKVEVDNDGSSVKREWDRDMEREFRLDISMYTYTTPTDDFTITDYGRYFFRQCKNVPVQNT